MRYQIMQHFLRVGQYLLFFQSLSRDCYPALAPVLLDFQEFYVRANRRYWHHRTRA